MVAELRAVSVDFEHTAAVLACALEREVAAEDLADDLQKGSQLEVEVAGRVVVQREQAP